jgi:hypothetical protein
LVHSLRKYLLLDWSIFRAERDERAQRKLKPAGITPLEMPGGLNAGDLAELTEQLDHPDWRVRLEATKKLATSRNAKTAIILVQLLHDENLSVRWAAAGGLKHLHRAAIRPLLEELTREFQSTALRKASHHVLQDLYMNGNLNQWEMEVYRSLERPNSSLQVARSANRALIASVGRA